MSAEVYKKSRKKNNAWKIRHLVDESFVPVTQRASVLYWRLSDFWSLWKSYIWTSFQECHIWKRSNRLNMQIFSKLVERWYQSEKRWVLGHVLELWRYKRPLHHHTTNTVHQLGNFVVFELLFPLLLIIYFSNPHFQLKLKIPFSKQFTKPFNPNKHFKTKTTSFSILNSLWETAD